MSDQELVLKDIKEILSTFTYFIESCESDLKTKTTVEEIKDHFKAAIFVEKVIKKFEAKGILLQFMSCLNASLDSAKNVTTYDAEYFRFGCDKMLLKYMKSNKYDIEIAIRMYSSFCGEERFESVVENLILNSGIDTAILNYLIVKKEELNIVELECRLMLTTWNNQVVEGNFEGLKKQMIEMFNSYKIDTYLPMFIKTLTLNDISDQEKRIKSLILNVLLSKMEDRSYMSKEFWITLIKNIDKNLLVNVCQEDRNFLKALLNFLVYCGCMMMNYKINTSRLWFGNPNKSICPEITAEEILNIVKSLLCIKGEISEYTSSYLEEAKRTTKSLFWIDLLKMC